MIARDTLRDRDTATKLVSRRPTLFFDSVVLSRLVMHFGARQVNDSSPGQAGT